MHLCEVEVSQKILVDAAKRTVQAATTAPLHRTKARTVGSRRLLRLRGIRSTLQLKCLKRSLRSSS